jgi:hypothetical protein
VDDSRSIDSSDGNEVGIIDLYFVVTRKSTAEIEVVREVRPPKILCSYFYFRNKLLADLVKEIGYKPDIFVDSGAYSAWTTGRNISPLDYMNYLQENQAFIHKYIALDVVGDPEMTWKYYEIMRMKGFVPIPVYHYQTHERYLERYIAEGESYIALGGTTIDWNKKGVAGWVAYLIQKYPNIKFHLLGSFSEVIASIEGLKSMDVASWFMRAINGEPKHIPGTSRDAKIKRAKWWMRHLLERKIDQQPDIQLRFL